MRKFRKTIRNPETLSHKKKGSKKIFQYDYSIDLHGLLGDEAIRRLDNFILSHENCVLLINHGKGEGILRCRVRNFLKESPEIIKIQLGEEIGLHEGNGVTVATIR